MLLTTTLGAPGPGHRPRPAARWRRRSRRGTSDGPRRSRPHRRPTSTPTWRPTSTRSLLRFITCGSVDDGKSTLIGRLLYDSKLVFEDQLAALEADSKKVGTQGGDLDFALLVDGLAAEREQGITIDVAYRFFSTERAQVHRRRHPGPRAVHPQHGHRRLHRRPGGDPGRRPQGRAHPDPAAQLPGLPARASDHVVLAVNKLDLVGYSEDVFDADRGRLPRLRRRDRARRHHRPSRCRPCAATTSPSRAPTRPGTGARPCSDYLETVEVDDDAGHASRSGCRCSGSTGPTSTSGASPAASSAARVAPGRPGPGRLPSGRETTVEPDRHRRRRPRRGRGRPVGHPHPGRRDRRQPGRRPGRRRRRPPGWPTSSRRTSSG